MSRRAGTLDPHPDSNGHSMRFVKIRNKNSGARISANVTLGKRAQHCCVLNSTDARIRQASDQLIAYCLSFE
ncbi:aspartate 1-decarboxylase [Bradyrhizobium nanningense]|uniref:aspartate 1-decarboxylase n=1 Tax=Bradyrhizobium nanningense TaxID=1325118 RepID=UPI001008CCAC|nr:aspartate 1-decarboxylase [Bradyrhizobium nanningense]